MNDEHDSYGFTMKLAYINILIMIIGSFLEMTSLCEDREVQLCVYLTFSCELHNRILHNKIFKLHHTS